MKLIEQPGIKTKTFKDAAKRSSIAEHLISNRDCGRKYEVSWFKLINYCNCVFDLSKLTLFL